MPLTDVLGSTDSRWNLLSWLVASIRAAARLRLLLVGALALGGSSCGVLLLLVLGALLSEATAAAEADDCRMWLGEGCAIATSCCCCLLKVLLLKCPGSAAISGKRQSAKTDKGFATSMDATSRRFARPGGLRGWLAQYAVCGAGRMTSARCGFNNPRCNSDDQKLN